MAPLLKVTAIGELLVDPLEQKCAVRQVRQVAGTDTAVLTLQRFGHVAEKKACAGRQEPPAEEVLQRMNERLQKRKPKRFCGLSDQWLCASGTVTQS